MKAIVCEKCGSNDMVKRDSVYVCQHCGTKYSYDKDALETMEAELEKQKNALFMAKLKACQEAQIAELLSHLQYGFAKSR